jgi:hypothetical protein
MESNGDWLLRKPKLTQVCSDERMDGSVLVVVMVVVVLVVFSFR